MIDLGSSISPPSAAGAGSRETSELDDAAAMRLLAAEDPESVAQLAGWLKAQGRTFAPVVAQAIEEGTGPSAEAARAVLGAVVSRTPADAQMTLALIAPCLAVIGRRITEDLASDPSHTISDPSDALVGSAVALLTSSRPARHLETAICCLSEAGPGGALILARAFDAVRSSLRLRILRSLRPRDVRELDDNVVVSLAESVSKLAEALEGSDRATATRFLAELGSVQHMVCSEIEMHEHLEAGDEVFHASWGAGIVVATTAEVVTIDFSNAGTRTLLRSLATLRRASRSATPGD